MKQITTQVAIIGAGPAGLFLSHILARHGIDSVVLERQTKAYVLSRIRAGVLEPGSVRLLREYGLNERMDVLGAEKQGTAIVWQDKPAHFIDTVKWTGQKMMAWGQTAITEDLFAARERDQGHIITEVENVSFQDLDTDAPSVCFGKDGEQVTLNARFIAGCDGYHGPSRQAIPNNLLRTYERIYPFGWLGIMTEVPPIKDFTYAYHERGFALAAQRNPMLSRYYVQCDASDKVENWSDDRFWEELLRRFPPDFAAQITTGPSIEKSIAPLRSFVAEPMRYGSLFLAGDAAHIVPPTGAKGLNLAFSDVYYLSRAMSEYFNSQNDSYLDRYSDMALRRIWSAVNISWRLTKLLHVFPDEDPFEDRIRQNDYDLLCQSEIAQQALATEYIGAPYED
jgi:p-hydroxybenzoate 3-monooxygenase